MTQIEFDIGGVAYRADKLDPFKQLHLSRKIGPVVPKMFPAMVEFAKLHQAGNIGEGDAVQKIESFSGVVESSGPFVEALASMSDEDVEYIIKTCLSVVRREQGDAWSPMVRDGVLMFSDLGLGDMLPIVVRVLRDNLGNFIQGLLAPLFAKQATQEETA